MIKKISSIFKWCNGTTLLSVVCMTGLGVLFCFNWDYSPFCDELENLYDAYLVGNGLLPYKDYFTNHLPGVHLLFAPLFVIFKPLLSNYQLHFVARLIVLLLQIFSQLYLINNLFIFSGGDIQTKQGRRSRLTVNVIVMLASYMASLIFMTNMVWSESFLYCYLLISFGFFLKLNNTRTRCRDSILFGIASGLSILVSLIAVPIVFCNICFIFLVLFVIRRDLRKRQFLYLLGGICLPLIVCFIFGISKIGWDTIYYQVWGLNQKYSNLSSSGHVGIFGVILRPLELALSCLKTNTLLPKCSLVFSKDRRSFLLIILCFTVINYLFLKIKSGCRPWLLVLFLLGLMYSSLIRGLIFHIGFAFHFAFILSIIWLLLLFRRRIAFDLPIFLKVILLIPVGVGIYLLVNACILNKEYFVSKANQTIREADVNIFEVNKLLASFNDLEGQRYKVWLPFFVPKYLYYAEIMPANKLYMYRYLFRNEPYFSSTYERVIKDDSILILPMQRINHSRLLSDTLKKAFTEKIEKQSSYIPAAICNFDTLVKEKEKNTDELYQYVNVQQLNEFIARGTKLVGIANRGYRYSFFFDCSHAPPGDIKFVITLSNENRKVLCSKQMILEKRVSSYAGKKKSSLWSCAFGVFYEVLGENESLRIDGQIEDAVTEIRARRYNVQMGVSLPGEVEYLWQGALSL